MKVLLSHRDSTTTTYNHTESAPLLRDGNPGNGGPHPPASPSITDRLGSILQHPLTTINKILLVLLLLFLLLSSVFIGLFIGSVQKLNGKPDAPGGDHPLSTVTVPSTATATVTTTSVTTITGAPAPGPSNPPEQASLLLLPLIFQFLDGFAEELFFPSMRYAFRGHTFCSGYHSGPLRELLRICQWVLSRFLVSNTHSSTTQPVGGARPILSPRTRVASVISTSFSRRTSRS